jgi:hypothetical protein
LKFLCWALAAVAACPGEVAREDAVDGGAASGACPPPELIGRVDEICEDSCSVSELVAAEDGMWGIGICINGGVGSETAAFELGVRDRGLPAGAEVGDKEILDSFIPISANAEVTPCT